MVVGVVVGMVVGVVVGDGVGEGVGVVVGVITYVPIFKTKKKQQTSTITIRFIQLNC